MHNIRIHSKNNLLLKLYQLNTNNNFYQCYSIFNSNRVAVCDFIDAASKHINYIIFTEYQISRILCVVISMNAVIKTTSLCKVHCRPRHVQFSFEASTSLVEHLIIMIFQQS